MTSNRQSVELSDTLQVQHCGRLSDTYNRLSGTFTSLDRKSPPNATHRISLTCLIIFGLHWACTPLSSTLQPSILLAKDCKAWLKTSNSLAENVAATDLHLQLPRPSGSLHPTQNGLGPWTSKHLVHQNHQRRAALHSDPIRAEAPGDPGRDDVLPPEPDGGSSPSGYHKVSQLAHFEMLGSSILGKQLAKPSSNGFWRSDLPWLALEAKASMSLSQGIEKPCLNRHLGHLCWLLIPKQTCANRSRTRQLIPALSSAPATHLSLLQAKLAPAVVQRTIPTLAMWLQRSWSSGGGLCSKALESRHRISAGVIFKWVHQGGTIAAAYLLQEAQFSNSPVQTQWREGKHTALGNVHECCQACHRSWDLTESLRVCFWARPFLEAVFGEDVPANQSHLLHIPLRQHIEAIYPCTYIKTCDWGFRFQYSALVQAIAKQQGKAPIRKLSHKNWWLSCWKQISTSLEDLNTAHTSRIFFALVLKKWFFTKFRVQRQIPLTKWVVLQKKLGRRKCMCDERLC